MAEGVYKYRLKDGTVRWRIVYDQPDADGSRRQTTKRGFRTEDEAKAARRKALVQIDEGAYVDPSQVTLRDYLLEEWLPSRKPRNPGAGRGHRGKVDLSTWDTYGTTIEAYVLPGIGNVKLQELSPDHLDALYDDLEESGGQRNQGLSPKTVSNVHGVIHKALADALRKGKVVRNVADAVEPPRAGKPDTDVWTAEQLRTFLTHVTEDRLYAMWLLFATTGMRRGEVAGLAWEDVDLDAGTLRVSWTLGVVDNKPTFKVRPKSDAGERTMSLDPSTVDALREWRARQAEERLALGPAWTETNVDWQGNSRDRLVFTWEDGTLINPERITRWFADHRQDAGLPHIRLHDVRHTYATAGLENATGWHEVKVISERLGHASVGITLDTYSHAMPSRDEEVAHTLARFILGETAKG